jgi:transcription-repair coupling factor (superfamily II helicase)
VTDFTIPDLKPGNPGRLLISGAPEGHDARILARLARSAGRAGLLHVAVDDGRAARLAEALAFFDPGLEVLSLPAWDCLPYDRVSPNPDIVARRIDVLTRLLETDRTAPLLVLTTVHALLQKVPPRLAFRNASFRGKVGGRINVAELQRFLANNGYLRAQTVREPGEYAVRGGIIDLFPPGLAEPVRLDLFGDELDGVRSFDPLTQTTTEKVSGFVLKPMSEVFLDEMSIQRFRTGYRELFGAVTDQDPLYEAVSAGRKQAGMEHWLPLFHPGLETLFDYLPHAVLTLDPSSDDVRDKRLEQIIDFQQARLTLKEAEKLAGSAVYKPVPPGRLFLDAESWDLHLATRAVGLLSPFAAVEGSGNAALCDGGGRRGRDFGDARAQSGVNVYDVVRGHIDGLLGEGRRVVLAGYSAGAVDRLLHVLKEHGLERLRSVESWAAVQELPPVTVAVIVLPLDHGFTAPGLALISEQDILGDRLVHPAGKRRRRAANFIAEAASLNPGDFVVHLDHGIGRYEGLETLSISGAPHDCLKVVYDGGDKLFVPVENIEVLSRYGSADSEATLDRLGGVGWQGRKAKVKKRLKDMAEALLRIAAERELHKAQPAIPPEGVWDEFCARFPYAETEDQQNAIQDVIEDMGSGRPMDRLICGDVGFGKTEVALRAAFLAAMNDMQVAVVVPTTLLARQHSRSFAQRFAGLPIQFGQLSRFATAKEAARVKVGLADGTVDIVIGTHALLGKLEFKRLGLVIVDEEQHFGVKQKERLKQLRADVHVLTLTATPIPRTLQLALAGVRELSLIATPPIDRLAVRTFVLPYDPMVIREAILREHYRGGQSFYVVPRIEDLEIIRQRILELVPEVKLVVAHGQMPATELEEVMTAFDDRRFDVLLATNIIESGLDIPSANTLIVHRADMFGLAQLYQIRGRVGRSKQRGYAYLTWQQKTALSATATQRLHVIETLDSLGAGFQLASHDMDIRGAGNLLGEEQSGHIREVGVELYQQMLDEAVAAARQTAKGAVAGEEAWSPQIALGMPVLIPEEYVGDLSVRLSLYRRVSDLRDRAEIDAFAAEMIDRFGKLPPEVENLLRLVELKRLCKEAGVAQLDAGPKGAVVGFRGNSFRNPAALVAFLHKQAGTAKLRPDHKLVLLRPWDSPETRMDGVRSLLQTLGQMAAGVSVTIDLTPPRPEPPPPPPKPLKKTFNPKRRW